MPVCRKGALALEDRLEGVDVACENDHGDEIDNIQQVRRRILIQWFWESLISCF